MRIAMLGALLCALAMAGCAGVKPPPPSNVAPAAARAPPPEAAAPAPSASAAPAEPTQGGPAAAGPAPAPVAPPAAASRSANRTDATAPAKGAAQKASPAPAPKKESPAATAPKQASPTLDLTSLEARLKDTKAIGVLTKIALKNQVDDLLNQFRAFYRGTLKTTLAELRRPYDLLVLKVISLLQDSDPALASAIAASREAIWGILSDPAKFATM